MHVEEGDILYTMYIRQMVLKVCKFLAILVYNLVYVGKISFLVACRVETSEVTGHASFCCNHTKAHLFSKLAFCYISFVCVYGITFLHPTGSSTGPSKSTPSGQFGRKLAWATSPRRPRTTSLYAAPHRPVRLAVPKRFAVFL